MQELQGMSKELEAVAIASLLKYPDILAKVSTEITEMYFGNLAYKLIYKCVKAYYNEFLALPSKQELRLKIRESYTVEYGDLEVIYTTLDDLFSTNLGSEDFALTKIVEFIRRVQAEVALRDVLRICRGDRVDLESVADTLSNALTINFTRTDVFNLADVSKLEEIKREALGSVDNPVIVKLFLPDLNDEFQYNGLIPGTLNCVCAPPGKGKSTFLINQGVSTAQQGFKLLHIFLGDMKKFDGFVRYVSCMTGISSKKLANQSIVELAKIVQKYNMSGFMSNVDIATYAVDQLTVNALIEEIVTIQKRKQAHYEVIIVDYDENINTEDVDMYNAGGLVYNKLAYFASVNNSVVFIASQPKTEFYSSEVLPLEALAESSKKQKIIDLLITLGRPYKKSSVGTVHIPKNRRGDEGGIFRIKFNGVNARITHISPTEYNQIRQEERNSGGVDE